MSIDRLYKYGRLNKYSEGLFSSGKIWFARPSALNDPFECRPLINFESTREQKRKAVAEMLRRRPEFNSQAAAAAEAEHLCQQGILDDSARWEAVARDLGRDASGVGLYCLSQVSDSILMWSHYALEHRGYCLEFAATDHAPVFGAAQKVAYSDDYPCINFFNTPHERQIELVFLTKFSGWAYEQEWRIIDYKMGRGLRPYPPELLRRVIFGLRMPENDRSQVRAWTSRRGHPVEFYEAFLHERRFAIDVRRVSG